MRMQTSTLVALGLSLALVAASLTVQSSYAAHGGPGAGHGGSGSGAGVCTSPCWTKTNLPEGTTDLAIQRRTPGLSPFVADRVAALVSGLGIYRSIDAGETFSPPQALKV